MINFAIYCPDQLHHILLLGPTDDYLSRVLKRDVAVTVLTEEKRLTNSQRAFLQEGNLVSFQDTEALLARAFEISNERKIDIVLSLTEMGMLPAAQIASLLGIPGPSLTATLLCRNKYLMRERIQRTGMRCNIPYLLINTAEDLAQFRTAQGDIVIKPHNGSGSVGVFKLDSDAEFSNALAFPFLAEKFIDGKEYSCETFSFNGHHHFLALTQKYLGGETGLVEIAHKIVLDDTNISETMLAQVFATLDQLEIKNGPAHTEIKILGDEIFVIETHNRPGGDRIWQLVEQARNFRIVEMTVDGLFSQAPVLHSNISNRCASIFYPQFPLGIVKEFNILTTLERFGLIWQDMELKVGDVIKGWQNSNDRNGAFLIAADDEITLEHNTAEIIAAIKLVVVPAC